MVRRTTTHGRAEGTSRRLGGLTILLAVVSLLLVGRLASLQFVVRDEVLALAERRGVSRLELPAIRGAVRDADGRVLARDLASFRVALAPSRFRERSLLFALADLEVLTGRADVLEPRAMAVRWTEPEGRGARLEALLAIAASEVALAPDELAARGAGLLRDGGSGRLVRRPTELSWRMRQLLGRLAGDRRALAARRLREARGLGTSLGVWLGVDAAVLESRLEAETRALVRLGEAVGLDGGLAGVAEKVGESLDREWAWIGERLQDELHRAFYIDAFGTERPGPDTIGSEAWAALVREVGLTVRGGAATTRRVRDGARIASALVAGRLPAPHDPADATEPDAEAEAPSWRAGTRRALGALRRGRVPDAQRQAVLTAWFQQRQRDDDHAEKASLFLSDRRRQDLVAGLRAGRGFDFGQGAGTVLGPTIWGTGGLEELGFTLTPCFDRDSVLSEELPATLRQMLGTVGQRERRGINGLEARMNEVLAGEDGEAGRVTGGALAVRRPARHGKDLELGISAELCAAFEEILREANHVTPAAIAVVDVRSGAIVGAASWPVPVDLDQARKERSDMEQRERALLKVRARYLDAGDRAQRIAFLEAQGTPEDDHELMALRALELNPTLNGDVLRRQLWALRYRKTQHGGWNRAYQNPGYGGPGSVFKALTILAGLESDAGLDLQTVFDCGPETRKSPRRPRHTCKAHGPAIGVRRALQVSCNEYCYRVGDVLGSARLVQMYERVGFFEPIHGLLPGTTAAMQRLLLRTDPKNLAIGGGDISCVPVRAAGIAATIARGVRVVPWLAVPEDSPIGRAPITTPDRLRAIHEGMRQVCEPGGTAQNVGGLMKLRIAAKTGTSDYRPRLPGGAKGKANEAWFVGFAPVEAPRYAFAALISRSQLNGARAAPMARDALEATAKHFGEVWW